ncbi:MAG: prolyl oligopeptidase family serine peptidase [Candidatus Dormibacteraceae bacterium]
MRRLLDPESIEPTGAPRRDHSPEWSPDSRRLAFISKVGPADQLFVLDIAQGETRQLSWVPDGVSSPLWSPDGTRIAFVGVVLSDPEAVVDDPRPPDARDQLRRSPVARVVRRLDYKHDGQGFVDGRYHHLFVVSAQGGSVTQLTSGAWDVTGFDWAPDANRLAVSGNAEPGADLQRELNLYIVDLAGNLHRFGGGFNLAAPAWSPRGDLIAFIAPNGKDAGFLERLWVVPLTGEGPRCLTANFDQAVTDSVITDMRAGHGSRLCWSSDGERIYFIASGPGVTGLYSSDLEGNVHQEAGGQRRIFDFDMSSGVVAFVASDSSQPGELHILTQGAEARLTDLNPWLHERHIAQPERHQFTAPDGWVIEGWVLKPEGLDPEKVHPLVLEVHGGPHGQYGWAFFHELQVLAGRGYVVLYLNPRGSDGYGERFRREVVRDWGGKDYADLMSALDQLIERTGYVDTNRLGIGGGSYGGYMTNWAIGQTNRFSAAVSMRSISNLVSEYSQHDIVLWGVLELGPPPYPDLDELWRRSPIRYVRNIRTPLLLTCGEMDLRCAISQSEEMFGAMRLLGKTVELVRFPEESHDLSRNGRPDRRVERLRRIAGWYERFLGTAAAERVLEAETQVLPVQAFATTEAPVGEPVAAEPVEVEAPAAVAALETETLVLPTLAPAEAVTGVHPASELADPESLPDLPEPGVVAELAQLEGGAPNPVLPMAGEGWEAGAEPIAEADPVAEAGPLLGEAKPEPEPLVTEAEPAPEREAEPEPMLAEVEPEPEPELPAEPQPEPEILAAEAEPEQVSEAEPEPEQVSEAEPEPELEPVVAEAEPDAVSEAKLFGGLEAPPTPTLPLAGEDQPSPGESSEPWLQAEQDSDPGRQPAIEAQPSVAAVETEAEPEPAVAAEQAAAEPVLEPAVIAAEPEAAAESSQATRPPASEADHVRSTMLRWPGSTSPGNGTPTALPQTFEEATSIIPAWQHSESPPDSRRTVSLQAVPVEQITAGGGFAAALTFETGPFAGRIVALPNQMVTFGRAPDNDVVVGDPATSGHHGRFEVRNGFFWISDLGSTNGTLVNGEPVIERQLGDGDMIAIGQNTMRFTLET